MAEIKILQKTKKEMELWRRQEKAKIEAIKRAFRVNNSNGGGKK